MTFFSEDTKNDPGAKINVAVIDLTDGERPSDEIMDFLDTMLGLKEAREEFYAKDPEGAIALSQSCGCPGCKRFLEAKGAPLEPPADETA